MAEALSLYRQLIRQTSCLVKGDRKSHLDRIRSEFSRYRNAPERDVPALLKSGREYLAFLQMLSPNRKYGRRTASERRPEAPAGETLSARPLKKVFHVDGAGNLVEATEASRTHGTLSNWGAGNPDPSAVRRHWALWDKQRRIGM